MTYDLDSCQPCSKAARSTCPEAETMAGGPLSPHPPSEGQALGRPLEPFFGWGWGLQLAMSGRQGPK